MDDPKDGLKERRRSSVHIHKERDPSNNTSSSASSSSAGSSSSASTSATTPPLTFNAAEAAGGIMSDREKRRTWQGYSLRTSQHESSSSPSIQSDNNSSTTSNSTSSGTSSSKREDKYRTISGASFNSKEMEEYSNKKSSSSSSKDSSKDEPNGRRPLSPLSSSPTTLSPFLSSSNSSLTQALNSSTSNNTNSTTGASPTNSVDKLSTTPSLASPSGVGIPTTNMGDEPILLAGWMRLKNAMKMWKSRWVTLRPGKVIYFNNQENQNKDKASGILHLADCQVKALAHQHNSKDGYALKIQNTRNHPIFSRFGLKGEPLKLANLARVPGGWSYCIMKVATEKERQTWIEALKQQIIYANTHNIRTTEKMPVMTPEQMANHQGSDDDDYASDHDALGSDISTPNINTMNTVANHHYDSTSSTGNTPNLAFSPPPPSANLTNNTSQNHNNHSNNNNNNNTPTSSSNHSNVPPMTPDYFEKEGPRPRTAFQKSLIHGLSSQQKTTAKSLQKQTIRTMEEWKATINERIASVEKKLMSQIATEGEGDAVHKTAKGTVTLSYMQLCLLIIFMFGASRILWNIIGV